MSSNDQSSPIAYMSLESMSITDHQKAKLKELFPEVFTEGSKIDFDKLKRTLGETIDAGKERFGMNWAGKADCFKTIQQPSVATLVPARDESVDFDTTENVFIEGDNLEVLKLLQKSYLGKIKMIYIDPPYNTGNDFIYPDNYSENLDTYLEYTGQIDGEGRKFSTNVDTDGRFHSKWMNMMYPRLFLAKNLLKDDGVLIVSIDDSEFCNLRAILNDTFGEENFIASLIWKHTQQSKNDEPYFSRQYNYQLIYRKSDKLESLSLPRTEKDNLNYSNPDNDPNGDWRTGDFRSPNYRKTLVFDIATPAGKIISPPDNGWRWSQETIAEKIASGEIIFNQDETRIIRKIYLKNQDGRTPENIWDGDECGTTRQANAEIKELFDGAVVFDTPKPTALVKRFINLFHHEKDFIALDFFAGSASTAHAVMDANKIDGGNRKFICVQLPEPTNENSEAYKAGYETIAEISKERIRRAARKIKSEVGENNQNKLDLGFRVFKLQQSNFKVWDSTLTQDPQAMQLALEEHIDHINPDASQEDILFELLLKAGMFNLTDPIETITLANKTVYNIADGGLLICLEKELTLELIQAIAEMNPPRVVVLDEGFQNNDQLKTNAALTMKSKGILDFRTV